MKASPLACNQGFGNGRECGDVVMIQTISRFCGEPMTSGRMSTWQWLETLLSFLVLENALARKAVVTGISVGFN